MLMSTKHGTLSAMKIHYYIWVYVVLTIATVSCSQAPTVEIDQSAPSTTVDVKATETPPSSNITEHNTVSSLNNSNTNGDTSTAPPTPTLTPAHDSINAGQLALRNSNWQAAIDSYIPVSYTHLTLPTSDLV